MKLYYSKGACSLAAHILLHELGLVFELERVDTRTHRTEAGADFFEINPKGYVPVLRLDSGEELTEGAAILQYLADVYGTGALAPPCGTLERARLQEHLNYLASEVHKAFAPLFHPHGGPEEKKLAMAELKAKFDILERHLAVGRDYLLGDRYSCADPYLFVILTWPGYLGFDLSAWPSLAAYAARIRTRPAVQAAMTAEGLVH